MNLSQKLAISLISVGLVIGLISANIYYYFEMKEETKRIESLAISIGPIIENSFSRNIEKGNLKYAEEKLSNFKNIKTISKISFINNDWIVMASTDNEDTGKKLSPDNARCKKCRETGMRSDSIREEGIFRWVQSAESGGVIIIDFSIFEMERYVKKDVFTGLVILFSAFLFVGYITVMLLNKLIVDRINNVIDTIRKFKEGDHSIRIPEKGKDEIQILCEDFNKMAGTISHSYNELKQAHQKYEELINSIDSIVWESDAKTLMFTFVSRKAEIILGYPVYRWLSEPTFWKDHIHPDDREWAVSFCAKATAEKRSHNFEYRMISLNGKVVWLRCIVNVVVENNIPVKLQGIMIDITKRKEAESAIKESEERFRGITERSYDAIITLDMEGRHTYISPSIEYILGYKPAELIGKDFGNFFQEPTRQKVIQAFSEAIKGKTIENTVLEITKKEGVSAFIEANGSPIIKNGKVIGVQVICRDITERKQTEEKLKESEERYRILVETANDVIYSLSTEGIFLFLNPAFEIVTGWSCSEWIGRHFADILYPNDLPIAIDFFQNVLKGELIQRREIRVMSKSGGYVVGEFTILPRFKDGEIIEIWGIARDITKRKQAEEALRTYSEKLSEQVKIISHSQKEWQDTFDNISDLVSIHDREFNVIRANMAFARHFGLHPREVINRKCYELFKETNSPVPGCPHKITMEEGRQTTSEILEPGTNRVFWISTFPYYTPEGEILGSIHIARDITELREKEMRLIITERLSTLGHMAAGIVHEINNPLSSIAGCAEGLLSRIKRGQYNPELYERYLKIIEEEIVRCKDITSSMLSFARKTTYEKKEISINELLDKTLEIIGFQGRLKDVELKRNYKEDKPVLFGSEGELRQVFLSIITNALDAMEDRGRLTIETGVEGERVFIKITDSGPGIPLEIKEKIFNPFFTTKSEKGGTGLGLSIARRILDNHNGSIDVSSEIGKGTTFRIILPSTHP